MLPSVVSTAALTPVSPPPEPYAAYEASRHTGVEDGLMGKPGWNLPSAVRKMLLTADSSFWYTTRMRNEGRAMLLVACTALSFHHVMLPA